jgi:hypothetical protein
MESEQLETDKGQPQLAEVVGPPTPEKEKQQPRRNETVHNNKLSAPLPRSPIKSSYDSPKKVNHQIVWCFLKYRYRKENQLCRNATVHNKLTARSPNRSSYDSPKKVNHQIVWYCFEVPIPEGEAVAS